jgi:Na+-transporting NADH:ubiquinone oxidoreductase subunit C
VALDASDLNTIKAFAFYEHGETPGLGGEVDNANWKRVWVGKQAFGDEFGKPEIDVVKGTADRDSPHEIDGLSGATLTANGVENLVRFWLGQDGYAKFLEKERMKRGEQHG